MQAVTPTSCGKPAFTWPPNSASGRLRNIEPDVVLKALAFRDRGENKDAYDLYYVVRNHGSSPADVASRLKPLLEDFQAKKALRILTEDFLDRDSLGPHRVATFIKGVPDDDIQAEVVGFIKQLLDGCA